MGISWNYVEQNIKKKLGILVDGQPNRSKHKSKLRNTLKLQKYLFNPHIKTEFR